MLRQLDAVTVVCGVVVLLGFLALWLLGRAERRGWPGIAAPNFDEEQVSHPFHRFSPVQESPIAAVSEFGQRPAPPQRRLHFTPDGRDKRKMPTAEWQEWLSAFDPNKENADRSPSYDAERVFRFGHEMGALRRRFRREIEGYDPSLWRCWADQDGDCWGDTVVDHIHPVSLFWSKRSRMGNLQCLCRRHNNEKGNAQPLDYRPVWLKKKYPN